MVVDVETACKAAQEGTRLCGHELVTCRKGKGVMCSRCQESRPATDTTFWQEAPCAGAHGRGAVDASTPMAQEEKQEALQITGTVAQIRAICRKRAATATAEVHPHEPS